MNIGKQILNKNFTYKKLSVEEQMLIMQSMKECAWEAWKGLNELSVHPYNSEFAKEFFDNWWQKEITNLK